MKKNYIDLHTHSVLSKHAYSSLTENIEYALSNGLKLYGISEHQPDDANAGAHEFAFVNAKRVTPNEINGMKILVGAEMNILDNGFETSNHPEKLDYCIASMHGYVYSKVHTFEQNTDNYIKAINTPYITFLGHLDYPIYKCNYEKVIKAVRDADKLIELNNASLVPNTSRIGALDIDKEILKHCAQYKVPVIMNTDAHIKYQIGNVEYAQKLLEEIDFPEELIVNYNKDLIKKFFKVDIDLDY